MASGISAGTRDTQAGRTESGRRTANRGARSRLPVVAGILVGLPLSLGLWLLLFLGLRALLAAV